MFYHILSFLPQTTMFQSEAMPRGEYKASVFIYLILSSTCFTGLRVLLSPNFSDSYSCLIRYRLSYLGKRHGNWHWTQAKTALSDKIVNRKVTIIVNGSPMIFFFQIFIEVESTVNMCVITGYKQSRGDPLHDVPPTTFAAFHLNIVNLSFLFFPLSLLLSPSQHHRSSTNHPSCLTRQYSISPKMGLCPSIHGDT